jgi:hypothetical protein
MIQMEVANPDRVKIGPIEFFPGRSMRAVGPAVEQHREFVRKNGLSQRVKNYQCRELQMVQPESWLRRKLRQVGLVS